MISSTKLTLQNATRICATIVELAGKHNIPPVAIVVVDAYGIVRCQQLMDDILPAAYPKFAKAKALTCVSMRMSTRAFREKYTKPSISCTNQEPNGQPENFAQMLNMASISGDAASMAVFPGGVLILDPKNNSVIGAVGVSGASSNQDEFLAVEGIKSCDLYKANECFIEPENHVL